MLDLMVKPKHWGSDDLCFIFFVWFAKFQILLCEPQSIWHKLLALSWHYKLIVWNCPYWSVALKEHIEFRKEELTMENHLFLIFIIFSGYKYFSGKPEFVFRENKGWVSRSQNNNMKIFTVELWSHSWVSHTFQGRRKTLEG